MKELDKNELKGVDGGYTIKVVGRDGIYFLDLETGRLYNILGSFVYQYPGEW